VLTLLVVRIYCLTLTKTNMMSDQSMTGPGVNLIAARLSGGGGGSSYANSQAGIDHVRYGEFVALGIPLPTPGMNPCSQHCHRSALLTSQPRRLPRTH
jgi:hypothetical protein